MESAISFPRICDAAKSKNRNEHTFMNSMYFVFISIPQVTLVNIRCKTCLLVPSLNAESEKSPVDLVLVPSECCPPCNRSGIAVLRSTGHGPSFGGEKRV